uniref:Uncharacterized protein n=1 Tax=Arundo donax TaxID=35708 RepID=A0A0A9FSN2_ARUDO
MLTTPHPVTLPRPQVM